MWVKYIILILFYLAYVVDGRKSIAIVTDTTASMKEEINILKNHINSVVKALPDTGDVENYILVPFKDPDVGTPQTSSNPEDLLNFLNDLTVEGGQDCLENSLAAVEKTLRISHDHSKIFLFTDAPPKDVDKLPVIQNLCGLSKSQVIIFLSGECPGEPGNNINVYNEIAKSCSGITFHLNSQNLHQGIQFMKAVVDGEWTIINTRNEFMGRKQFNFNIEAYTKDLIIAVAGNYPEIQVTNANGENAAVETIMATNTALVIRVLQPLPGEYAAQICSKGQSLPTFYKSNTLEFLYGFSPRKPKSLNGTTDAPLPDATSYLIIELLESDVELFQMDLQIGSENRNLNMEILDEEKRVYVAQTFFRVDQQFRMAIYGIEKNTHEVLQGKSRLIYPQAKVTRNPIGPAVELVQSESEIVEFMSNVTLYCKVTGEPKPEIWWVDDKENRLNAEEFLFEWPSTYMSYATIDSATTNTTVYCKSKNFEGEESSMSTEVFVHRDFFFEVIKSPSDITVEYGSEGKLFCEVTAYPEANIQWYHNGSTVTNNDNLEIIPEENELLIKNMTLDDTGEYVCEVSNTMNSQSLVAVVGISGLEAPSIQIASLEYTLEPGDSVEIECQIVGGNPIPNVSWKKGLNDELVDMPDGMLVEENSLKIASARGEHSGTYQCTATNIQGEVTKEIVVKVYYKPVIKNSDELKKVNVGEWVQLGCDVDAEPQAMVSWNMYQDGSIVEFDERHITDDQFTHRFIAQPHDSGIYCCVAENEVGRSERNITVIVLEPPYIEPLEFNSLRVRVGSTLQIPCNVSLGHPVPVTRWEFISTRSIASVMSRKTTKRLDLVLRNITKTDEGFYQCVSENEVAPDFVKFYLNVVP